MAVPDGAQIDGREECEQRCNDSEQVEQILQDRKAKKYQTVNFYSLVNVSGNLLNFSRKML